MRKDFDTGQNSQKITYRQLYSLSHQLISLLLCLALLGTLFLHSPGVAAAGTETDDVASSSPVLPEEDFPLSDSDTEDHLSSESAPVIASSRPLTVEEMSTTTANDDVATTAEDIVVADESSATSSVIETADEVRASVSTSTASSGPLTTDTLPPVATTSSSTEIATTTAVLAPDDLESPEVPDSERIEQSSTSSSPEVSVASSSGSVVYVSATDDNLMQFDRTKCTPVADGSYYCQRADTGTDGNRTDIQDGVHALPDADGDLEIFVVQDGEFTQLTFNTVDDAAPSYDPVSNTIVWHRSIRDRYQIMVYDFATKAEKQLTNDSVNNMQPVQSGEFIAWQRWVENNWQIMLYDGSNTTQLTYSSHHNIAPAIRGNYLLWKQQRADDEQTVAVYDLQSRQQYTISDPDGGVISNPRMMLLYESQFDNGDVVTRGLDLATNEIVPIQATPIPLPENIPSPEPLNEVRALVTKTTNEDDDDRLDDTEPIDDTDTASTTESIAEPGDIVMTNQTATTTSTSTATSTVATDDEVDMTLDLRTTSDEDLISEYDIFVAPFTASSTDVELTTEVDEELSSDYASSTEPETP